MKQTGSCCSCLSQAGLIENQVTVLGTKAALGPWQELQAWCWQVSVCGVGYLGPCPLLPLTLLLSPSSLSALPAGADVAYHSALFSLCVPPVVGHSTVP